MQAPERNEQEHGPLKEVKSVPRKSQEEKGEVRGKTPRGEEKPEYKGFSVSDCGLWNMP